MLSFFLFACRVVFMLCCEAINVFPWSIACTSCSERDAKKLLMILGFDMINLFMCLFLFIRTKVNDDSNVLIFD